MTESSASTVASPQVNEIPAPPCLFCGAALTHTLCDLGMSPPCESFLPATHINQMEAFYPLHVRVCPDCYLVQLEVYVAPEDIFTEYAYFSSFSDSWLDHARRYVEMITERLALDADSQVVELASNDGYLLQYFVQNGIPCYGVEPAANVAEAARAKGVESEVIFFSEETAAELRDKRGQADLILGNNVLAQVPDVNSFVGGMKMLLKPGGVVTIEFPHLMRMIDENQFDTIYHEHFFYFSFLSATRIFAEHGLVLFDVEELPTHGGSLRIYGRHAENDALPLTDRAHEMIERERAAGFESMAIYTNFGAQVEQTKRSLLKFLIEAREQGKRVVGYGAPGKGNTLLNYCGIRTDFIEFVVDRNPYKHGRFLPGTHIPVHPTEKLTEARPDYVLILPWNLKDEIMTQLAEIRSWGGKFVVPIPETTVYE